MAPTANENHDPAQLERIGEMLEAGRLDGALLAAGYDPQRFRHDLDAIAKVAARQDVPHHEIIRNVREIKAMLSDIEAMLEEAYGEG